jgi:hypothetical protein
MQIVEFSRFTTANKLIDALGITINFRDFFPQDNNLCSHLASPFLLYATNIALSPSCPVCALDSYKFANDLDDQTLWHILHSPLSFAHAKP